MRVCAVRTTVPNSPTASHGDDCMGSPTATWSVVDVSPGIVAPRSTVTLFVPLASAAAALSMLMALALTESPAGFCPSARLPTEPRSTRWPSGTLTELVALEAMVCSASLAVRSSPGTLAIAVAIWPTVAFEPSTSE